VLQPIPELRAKNNQLFYRYSDDIGVKFVVAYFMPDRPETPVLCVCLAGYVLFYIFHVI
jgi:hypothetical protein